MKYKFSFLMLSLTFVLLVVPFSAKALGTEGKISESCQTAEQCQVVTDFEYENWNDETRLYNTYVRCQVNRCVVPSEDVAIGTWCSHVSQCQTQGLEFTCDVNKAFCVGGVERVACVDALARLNKDANIGTVGSTILTSERCATGLVCNDGDSGECENDLGQGKVPTDKLGDTAEDIRDQIRNIINIALGFLGVAGVIVTIYGGALWMSAAGDDEKVGKAKKTIVSGLIGLVIIGIAWTIVSYVLTITQDIA